MKGKMHFSPTEHGRRRLYTNVGGKLPKLATRICANCGRPQPVDLHGHVKPHECPHGAPCNGECTKGWPCVGPQRKDQP